MVTGGYHNSTPNGGIFLHDPEYFDLAFQYVGSRLTMNQGTFSDYHNLDRNATYFLLSTGCYPAWDGPLSGIFHSFCMNYEYYYERNYTDASSSRLSKN